MQAEKNLPAREARGEPVGGVHGGTSTARRWFFWVAAERPLRSEEIADAAADYADILIAFGSVDPLTGDTAVSRAIPYAGRQLDEEEISRGVEAG